MDESHEEEVPASPNSYIYTNTNHHSGYPVPHINHNHNQSGHSRHHIAQHNPPLPTHVDGQGTVHGHGNAHGHPPPPAQMPYYGDYHPHPPVFDPYFHPGMYNDLEPQHQHQQGQPLQHQQDPIPVNLQQQHSHLNAMDLQPVQVQTHEEFQGQMDHHPAVCNTHNHNQSYPALQPPHHDPDEEENHGHEHNQHIVQVDQQSLIMTEHNTHHQHHQFLPPPPHQPQNAVTAHHHPQPPSQHHQILPLPQDQQGPPLGRPFHEHHEHGQMHNHGQMHTQGHELGIDDDELQQTPSPALFPSTTSKKKLSAMESWNLRFSQLAQFRLTHGHVDVPQTYKENKPLGKWVGKQREHYKQYCKNKNTTEAHERKACPLTEERVQRLESLGFRWAMGKGQYGKIHGIFDGCGTMKEKWEEKFVMLEKFKRIYGHVDVTHFAGKKISAVIASGAGTGDSENFSNLPVARNHVGNDDMISNANTNDITNVHPPLEHMSEEEIKSLSRWVKFQLQKFRDVQDEKVVAGQELGERFHRLQNLGLNLAQEQTKMEENFDVIDHQMNENGHNHGHSSSLSTSTSTPPSSLFTNFGAGASFDHFSIWEMRYKELCEYIKVHGNANVPSTFAENRPLARWVIHQREQYRARRREVDTENIPFDHEISTTKNLVDTRIERLLQIGFQFDVYGNRFEERLEQLSEYIRKKGHHKVRYNENRPLYEWMSRQRVAFRDFMQGDVETCMRGSNAMTIERISQLEAIGFDFQYRFEILKPDDVKAIVNSAEKWNKKESEETMFDKSWNENGDDNNTIYPNPNRETNELSNIEDCLDPEDIEDASSGLGETAVLMVEEVAPEQQQHRDSGPQYVNKVVRNPPEQTTGSHYESTRTTLQTPNPSATPPNETNEIRFAQDAVIMQSEDAEMLQTVDAYLAPSSPQTKTNDDSGAHGHKKGTKPALWDMRYKELVKFYQSNGHCRVPGRYAPNPKLGTWVKLQREDRRRMEEGKPSPMCKYRVRLLEKIEFEFSVFNMEERRNAWNVRFNELTLFKEKFGHCDVPQKFSQNKSLGKWVSKQRDYYRELQQGKKVKLTKERVSLLKALGFRFFVGKGKSAPSWDAFFDELILFMDKYEHSHIPLCYIPDPKLGKWAYQQRLNYHRHNCGRVSNDTTKHRLAKLESIGFAFHVKAKKYAKKKRDLSTQLPTTEAEIQNGVPPKQKPRLGTEREDAHTEERNNSLGLTESEAISNQILDCLDGKESTCNEII